MLINYYFQDENLHPYIKMMTSPMILEGFKFKVYCLQPLSFLGSLVPVPTK